MPRSRDELFWLALAIVAALVLMVAANRLLRPPKPRRGRWLPLVLGLTLLVPAACAHRPPQSPDLPPHHGAGWDDEPKTPYLEFT